MRVGGNVRLGFGSERARGSGRRGRGWGEVKVLTSRYYGQSNRRDVGQFQRNRNRQKRFGLKLPRIQCCGMRLRRILAFQRKGPREGSGSMNVMEVMGVVRRDEVWG
jgi:hypothetical protein